MTVSGPNPNSSPRAARVARQPRRGRGEPPGPHWQEPSVTGAELSGSVHEVGARPQRQVRPLGQQGLDAGFDGAAQSVAAGLVVQADDEAGTASSGADSQESDETGSEAVGVDDIGVETADEAAQADDERGITDTDSGAHVEGGEANTGQ